MKQFILTGLLLLFSWSVTDAEVQSRSVTYKEGEKVFQGYLAMDDGTQESRPGVLIVHQWKGLGEYEKMRAAQLAEMGYIAFALDMYGKGIRPETSTEASTQAKIYRDDRKLMRERAISGLEVLRKTDFVEQENIAAIGFCFGGGVVLELARSGADIAGVVSFHGN